MKQALLNDFDSRLNDEVDITSMMVEICRYLATVDEFRREGCEPHWHAESRSAR